MARAEPTPQPAQATSEEKGPQSDTEEAAALPDCVAAPGPSGGIAPASANEPSAAGPSGGISPKTQSPRR